VSPFQHLLQLVQTIHAIHKSQVEHRWAQIMVDGLYGLAKDDEWVGRGAELIWMEMKVVMSEYATSI